MLIYLLRNVNQEGLSKVLPFLSYSHVLKVIVDPERRSFRLSVMLEGRLQGGEGLHADCRTLL